MDEEEPLRFKKYYRVEPFLFISRLLSVANQCMSLFRREIKEIQDIILTLDREYQLEGPCSFSCVKGITLSIWGQPYKSIKAQIEQVIREYPLNLTGVSMKVDVGKGFYTNYVLVEIRKRG